MRRSRNFRQGWGDKKAGRSDKKSSDNVFILFCFLLFFQVLSLFYCQMVNFEENYHFSRFQRGSNIFQAGVQLFPGGSNCLFPIGTHITRDFPGGSGPPAPPPPPALWIRTCILHTPYFVVSNALTLRRVLGKYRGFS